MLPFNIQLLSALSTGGISAKYGRSSDVILMFYVLAGAVMAPDPTSLALLIQS